MLIKRMILTLGTAAFVVNAACTMNNNGDRTRAGPQVRLELKSTRQNGHTHLECILINDTSEAIVFDKRLLNPILLTKITQMDGVAVPTYPPPTPRIFEEGDALVLKPQRRHVISYGLGEVLDVTDVPASIRIRCVYQAGHEPELPTLNFWRERLESNSVVIDIKGEPPAPR